MVIESMILIDFMAIIVVNMVVNDADVVSDRVGYSESRVSTT